MAASDDNAIVPPATLITDRDQTTLAGQGVSVNAVGPTFSALSTDAFSDYRFGFLPLGSYTLEAADDAGHDREDQVERSDILVVGGKHPATHKPLGLVVCMGVMGD